MIKFVYPVLCLLKRLRKSKRYRAECPPFFVTFGVSARIPTLPKFRTISVICGGIFDVLGVCWCIFLKCRRPEAIRAPSEAPLGKGTPPGSDFMSFLSYFLLLFRHWWCVWLQIRIQNGTFCDSKS